MSLKQPCGDVFAGVYWLRLRGAAGALRRAQALRERV